MFFYLHKKNVHSKALILNLGHTDLPLCNVPKQEHPSVLSMSTARLIGKYWNNTCHKNSKNFRFNPIRSGLFQTVNDPGGGVLKAPPPLRSRKL